MPIESMITSDNIDGEMGPHIKLQCTSTIHHPHNEAIPSNPILNSKESVYKWIYNAQTMQNIANNPKTLTIP